MIEKQVTENLSARANLSEITSFVKSNKKPVDYQKLFGENRLICICERHTLHSDKDEIIKNVKKFKEMGITHMAFEMFSEDNQSLIDGYLSGKVKRQEILGILEGWDKRPGMADKYVDMVDACKLVGIKILAIEIPDELYISKSQSETLGIRNEKWAMIINNTLEEDNNARVLLYCGAFHCGYNMVQDHVNEIFTNRYKKSSVVIGFAGGELAKQDPSFLFDLYDKVPYAAKSIKIDNEKFVLRLDEKEAARPADYIIHLPQVE